MAEPYRDDMDFAFFVVNFGYTKDDYLSLTKREVAFIKKAWENKIVLESNIMNRVVTTANYNVNRGKKKYQKLWTKKIETKSEFNQADFEGIKKKEAKKGFGWLDTILGRRKNGR